MQYDILNKIKNNEYISKKLYDESISNNIIKTFDLEKYNNNILEKEYLQYKEYFENMFKDVDKNIVLDKEQIMTILADEDYEMIIAGAGTGKTTTIVAKIKYLVEIKKVNPEKILVISFTKKATEELEKRIYYDFNIPAKITTFHSLGFKYIREIFKDRICYVVSTKEQDEIFYNYFKERIFPYKDKVKELFNLFERSKINTEWSFGKYFRDNYDKYNNFDEYFNSYKLFRLNELKKENKLDIFIKDKIEALLNQENIVTIKGEFVKSKGEAIIANYLFTHNIEYLYEDVYENLMDDNKSYKPDFTLNLNGEKVYLEYYGLINYKEEFNKYNKIKQRKDEYHKINHNKYIGVEYSKEERIIDKLERELLKLGFKLNNKSNEEILMQILDNNPCSQFYPFKDFLFDIINIIKTSDKRDIYTDVVNEYINKLTDEEKIEATKQFMYIKDFYKYYQTKLYGAEKYGFDYSDMLYYANKYIEYIGKDNDLLFKYVLIDEYQDISKIRYEFTKKIIDSNGAKVIAVGDDWQTIYSFAGSKIEYIYDFESYYKGAKIFYITRGYRNCQSLINYTSKFIMQNAKQIKKELSANKEIKNPINFITYNDKVTEIEALERLINLIHKKNNNHKILILARNNKTINKIINSKNFSDGIGTKIIYKKNRLIDINAMTIHKSKGLTSDEVIIMGLYNNFPSTKTVFWLKNLFLERVIEEPIAFAEERRVFYVGLTRTKNHVYLLINENIKNRSDFINELYKIIADK